MSSIPADMASYPGVSRPDVLIVGFGDLGSAIAQQLVRQGCNVVGMKRNLRDLADGVGMLYADVTRPETLTDLQQLDPRVLLYCVSADQQSDTAYRAHYVEGFRNVLTMLGASQRLQHVFFVSSTRVYGQTEESLLNEADVPRPGDFGGERLLEGERLLDGLGCSHTVLRLSGIYGPGRRYLLQLAADRANWPMQNVWSNRIHRDDAAGFIAMLVQWVLVGRSVERCYIVTDSCPVPQHEVLRWMARRSGNVDDLPASPSPSGGKRLSNARLRSSGYTLRYPDYKSGYAGLFE